MIVPFDKIGIDVSDISLADALETAGVNFTVEVVPAYLSGSTLVHNYYFIIRTDTRDVLGCCKGRFVPVQNNILLDIAEPLINDGKAIIDTIGSFNNGAKVWMLLKLIGYQFSVARTIDDRSDSIDYYLLLVNGHDAQTSVQIGVVPYRIFCTNMLSSVRHNMSKFRHTSRLNSIQNISDFVLAHNPLSLTADLRSLVTKECSPSNYESYCRAIFFESNTGKLPTRSLNVLKILQSKFNGTGTTWWDAYNAVTNYINYDIGRNQETRIRSLWFGRNKKLLDKALHEALSEA
jgi:hypothetical protein